MDFKVQSVFLDLRCAFYQQVNLDREKHGIYFSNFTKDIERKNGRFHTLCVSDYILLGFDCFNLRCLMNM